MSPTKMGPGNLFGGGGIQSILMQAGAITKDKTGLTMDNKNFRKLDKGGTVGAAKSQTGRSQNSRGTRKTATSKSRRS
jgi:hypothetical protein